MLRPYQATALALASVICFSLPSPAQSAKLEQKRSGPLSFSASLPGKAKNFVEQNLISVNQLRAPRKAINLLVKADEYLRRNDLQKAKDLASRALDVYPEYAQALTLRGTVELQNKDFDRATDDVQHAIDQDPHSATAYFVMAAIFNSQSRYREAALESDRALAIAPGAWQGYFEASRAALGLGDFANALRYGTQASSLCPDFYPTRVVLAESYLGLKHYSQAAEAFRAYLKIDPNSDTAARVRTVLARVPATALADNAK